MKISIIAILLSISAITYSQEQTDTIEMTSAVHVQAMPELLNENQKLQEAKAQIDLALKNNTEKIMLIVASYIDPKQFTGQFTKDMKIIAKK